MKYVGIDVDDTQYHGSAFNKDTGEALDFKCRPTLKGLLNQLDKLAKHFPGGAIRLRSRQKLMQQRTQLRKHLQAVLRRNGLQAPFLLNAVAPIEML
jgi:hypothetical protein